MICNHIIFDIMLLNNIFIMASKFVIVTWNFYVFFLFRLIVSHYLKLIRKHKEVTATKTTTKKFENVKQW